MNQITVRKLRQLLHILQLFAATSPTSSRC